MKGIIRCYNLFNSHMKVQVIYFSCDKLQKCTQALKCFLTRQLNYVHITNLGMALYSYPFWFYPRLFAISQLLSLAEQLQYIPYNYTPFEFCDLCNDLNYKYIDLPRHHESVPHNHVQLSHWTSNRMHFTYINRFTN